ncbi:protein tyrosine/serine phosphatase [Ketogulonicigenium robustum]|uniref:Protein tyrosine/serine phosphatase n=1 Tax=Ketogulonicigenium robustum TaxID=92947 RepID=A0A1W6P0W4_9RHOB|nr:tyrosine-protein phosphatase [Ketogulonicigenium robustum]ARO15156.1 protein tyrosine/serine phosphatase [Ketogulonicigenium robustum]
MRQDFVPDYAGAHGQDMVGRELIDPELIDIANVARPRSLLARLDVLFRDHAILRFSWANAHQICPGVWRANHPVCGRLRHLRKQGITSVLTLRSSKLSIPTCFTAATCHELGLKLYAVGLQARSAPTRASVLRLFNTFRQIERPFVMHCKSGADRSGFAAALYLMAFEGQPLAVARKQLSLKYLHVRSSRAGVLDHILDLYAADTADAPMGIEAWFATRYDAAAAHESFLRTRGR